MYFVQLFIFSGGYNLFSVYIVPQGHFTKMSTVALQVLIHMSSY